MFESGSIKENLLDDNEYIKGNEHNKVDSSSSQRLQMIVKQLKSRTSIVGYIVFVNESCRGLLFPVLWPLYVYILYYVINSHCINICEIHTYL